MSSVRTTWILSFNDRISGPMRRVRESTESARRSAHDAQGAFTRLKRVAGTFLSAYAIVSGAKAMLRLGVEAETTETKFQVLTGSMGNAKRMLDEINQFANKTPFDNKTLREGAELLLNFGIAQEKILPAMKMLGDVSGGNKEKFKALSLAYAQVQSTGRLMGQDLLQMINAGFNPLTVIAEKTGRSMAQLKEDMAKGRISAEMVTEAFRLATGPGGRFHNMLEKVSETAGGKLSTLMGMAREKIAQFSKNNLIPFLKKALDVGIALVRNFGKVYNVFKRLFNAVQPLIKAIWGAVKAFFQINDLSRTGAGAMDFLRSAIDKAVAVVEIMANGFAVLIKFLHPLMPAIRFVAKAILALTVVQWAWNAAMAANPLGLVITGLAALIGGVKYAYDHFEKFRGVVDGAWAAIKGFALLIKNYVINRFKELLSGITGIGKALYYFFTGHWKKAWEAGKEGVKGIIGVDAARKAVRDAHQLGQDVRLAYDRGRTSVTSKSYKPSKSLAGVMHYKPGEKAASISAAPARADFQFDFSPATATGGKGQTSGSKTHTGTVSGASGGSGRSLTMNLSITNVFKVAEGARHEIDRMAEQITQIIVDKLRDAEISMG